LICNHLQLSKARIREVGLEKLVRDALELVEVQNGTVRPGRLPTDFFARIASEFGGEIFERPPQGDFEKREGW
jgi:hypothetical protein